MKSSCDVLHPSSCIHLRFALMWLKMSIINVENLWSVLLWRSFCTFMHCLGVVYAIWYNVCSAAQTCCLLFTEKVVAKLEQ